MSFFLCLWRPSGQPVGNATRAAYATRLPEHVGGRVRWVGSDALWACVPEPDGCRAATLEASASGVCVGDVRLDHRADVIATLGNASARASDQELVLDWVARRGAAAVRDLLGDFAFVVWRASSRELVIARDAFGVRALAYRETPDLVAISTHASCLGGGRAYDLEFITDFLIAAGPSERTIFDGVAAVQPGTYRVYRGPTGVSHRYWSAFDFAIDNRIGDDEACARFRGLFSRAVRERSGDADTWAQLSGGLDSSSVVMMAAALEHAGEIDTGLSGVITFVDTKGGDERPYGDAVIQACGMPAHEVTDFWLWQDDGDPPPQTDEPTAVYPFFARDRRFTKLVRQRGGRVLLSGQGSDHYIAGSLAFITDLIATGHPRDAVRELARRAVSSRRSFWRLAFEHGIEPFLPAVARSRVTFGWNPPRWMDRRFARRHDVASRMPARPALGWRRGARFVNEIANTVNGMAIGLDRGVIGDALDVRYPFLYRPLVEFCLRLPVAMRIRDGSSKWIQREAMRGLLPEMIRSRRTKGIIDGRVEWSLQHERARLDAMLHESVLGDLGCVDVTAMRRAVEEARSGNMLAGGDVVNALGLETWLHVRAGRWKAQVHVVAHRTKTVSTEGGTADRISEVRLRR